MDYFSSLSNYPWQFPTFFDLRTWKYGSTLANRQINRKYKNVVKSLIINNAEIQEIRIFSPVGFIFLWERQILQLETQQQTSYVTNSLTN